METYIVGPSWGLVWDSEAEGAFFGSASASSGEVYVYQGVSEPSATDVGIKLPPALPLAIFLGSGQRVYARTLSGSRPLVLTANSVLPLRLLTDAGGDNARLRVDPGQTGFFDGREFRVSVPIALSSGQVRTFKFVSPIDFIIWKQSFSVSDGGVLFEAVLGGTESGAFSTPISPIGKNRMTEAPQPPYAPQVTIAYGGAVTGGTVVETVRLKTANSTAQEATVGASSDDERGLPAGTTYLRFTNTGNGDLLMEYTLMWEERP